ncbi:MAG TPA: peptidylprolyl isomerase [Marmoricola sp.]|nr:peptidylprolyl isomerase [Marmoricola sp.]
MIRARPAVLLALALPLLLAGCGGTAKPESASSNAPCHYTADGSTAARKVSKPPSTPPADLPKTLTVTTNVGAVSVRLDTTQAPCAVNSLVSLARQGFFDRTPCHRLSTQGYFVLQCGDPTGTGRGGPGYSFADELVDNDPRLQPCGVEAGQDYCTYNAGTVAMANAGPNTNGSQFFLVYGNSKFPPDYTVLGNMDAAGLKVLKEIAARGIAPGSDTPQRPGDGAPKDPVIIASVSVS